MLQEISNEIKNATSHWFLTLAIALWSFGSPPGLHLPKWELPWECEGSLPHTPSHFLTLRGVCDVTLGLLLALIPGLPSFRPVTLQPLCLSREPKARVATLTTAPHLSLRAFLDGIWTSFEMFHTRGPIFKVFKMIPSCYCCLWGYL